MAGPKAPLRHPAPEWRPLVTLNAAASLDGKIAASGGRTLRLSDDEDLRRVHALRAEHDAILVGIGTVLADDPGLMVKRELHAEGRDPVRVVLDSHRRTPVTARVASGEAKTILYCVEPPVDRPKIVHSVRGVDVVACPADTQGRVDLDTVLRDLHARGIRSLLVEGGSRVISSFLRGRVVDRVSLFISPVAIGGNAPSLVTDPAPEPGDWLHGMEIVHSETRPTGVTLYFAPSLAPR